MCLPPYEVSALANGDAAFAYVKDFCIFEAEPTCKVSEARPPASYDEDAWIQLTDKETHKTTLTHLHTLLYVALSAGHNVTNRITARALFILLSWREREVFLPCCRSVLSYIINEKLVGKAVGAFVVLFPPCFLILMMHAVNHISVISLRHCKECIFFFLFGWFREKQNSRHILPQQNLLPLGKIQGWQGRATCRI